MQLQEQERQPLFQPEYNQLICRKEEEIPFPQALLGTKCPQSVTSAFNLETLLSYSTKHPFPRNSKTGPFLWQEHITWWRGCQTETQQGNPIQSTNVAESSIQASGDTYTQSTDPSWCKFNLAHCFLQHIWSMYKKKSFQKRITFLKNTAEPKICSDQHAPNCLTLDMGKWEPTFKTYLFIKGKPTAWVWPMQLRYMPKGFDLFCPICNTKEMIVNSSNLTITTSTRQGTQESNSHYSCPILHAHPGQILHVQHMCGMGHKGHHSTSCVPTLLQHLANTRSTVHLGDLLPEPILLLPALSSSFPIERSGLCP